MMLRGAQKTTQDEVFRVQRERELAFGDAAGTEKDVAGWIADAEREAARAKAKLTPEEIKAAEEADKAKAKAEQDAVRAAERFAEGLQRAAESLWESTRTDREKRAIAAGDVNDLWNRGLIDTDTWNRGMAGASGLTAKTEEVEGRAKSLRDRMRDQSTEGGQIFGDVMSAIRSMQSDTLKNESDAKALKVAEDQLAKLGEIKQALEAERLTPDAVGEIIVGMN
jgi:hypothetical protein